MSLQELPTALLHSIALYIPDGVRLYHFEASCRNTRAAVAEIAKDLWHNLYCRRWSFRNCETQLDKRAYAERHLKDQRATKLLQVILQKLEDTHANSVALNELRELFALGKEVIDVLWISHDNARTATEREQTKKLLTLLQCSAILKDIIRSFHYRQSTSFSLQVEELAILMSILGSLRTYRNYELFAQEAIRDSFENVAQAVRERLAEEGMVTLTTNTATQIFQTFNAIFFLEQGFSDDWENEYDDSLLHVALQEKRATIAVLPVLYQSVARRLGMEVVILRHESTDIVEIPFLNTYIDMFDDGRVVHMEELDSNHFIPFTPQQILGRMCINMMIRIVEDPRETIEERSLRSLMERLVGVIVSGIIREGRSETMILEMCYAHLFLWLRSTMRDDMRS